MLTDPRQIGEVLEHARRVAEREEPRPNSPEDVGYFSKEREDRHATGSGKAGASPDPGPATSSSPVPEQSGPPVAKCRSCSEPVYWCVTGTGAAMPVNVAPTPTGNLSLRWNGERVLAVYVDASFPGPRRVSHFANCPNAGAHRKKR